MSRINEQLSPDFDGRTYEPAKDRKRLTGQLARVREIMSDGGWYNLSYLAICTRGTEASVSARIRDLRKPKFGSHIIDRRRVGDSGLFQYRLVAGKNWVVP